MVRFISASPPLCYPLWPTSNMQVDGTRPGALGAHNGTLPKLPVDMFAVINVSEPHPYNFGPIRPPARRLQFVCAVFVCPTCRVVRGAGECHHCAKVVDWLQFQAPSSVVDVTFEVLCFDKQLIACLGPSRNQYLPFSCERTQMQTRSEPRGITKSNNNCPANNFTFPKVNTQTVLISRVWALWGFSFIIPSCITVLPYLGVHLTCLAINDG